MDQKFKEEIEEVIRLGTLEEDRFNIMLDLKVADCDKEKKTIDFDIKVQEWQLNPYGGIHGGVICALFDTSMGIGACTISGKMAATTDISLSYLKPMTDKAYIFTAEYTNIGHRMIRCVGKAYSKESGLVCATAMASFMVSKNDIEKLQV